jgi:hypothetical protein
MTTTWTIVAWFALQLPLAVFVGKFMKFGLAEPERQSSAMPRRSLPRRNAGFAPAIHSHAVAGVQAAPSRVPAFF